MMVDIFFTDVGAGFYKYDLTITNTGSDNIVLLTIEDAPSNDLRIASSLTAPAGFAASYDATSIDFLENTQSFTAGSVRTGFSFESAAAPGSAFNVFSGLTSEGVPVTVTSTLVPEPASALLGALGLMTLVSRRRR